MKHDVFVSYRRSDRELVAQIVRQLENRGVGVWYDAEMGGGVDWTDNIVAALQDSQMLVIFFSEACNSSKHLKRELLLADDLNKPVVPILIDDTTPKGGYLYLLADRNWVEAYPDPESRIHDIVEHLAVLSKKDGPPQPAGGASGDPAASGGETAQPAPAPEPMSSIGRTAPRTAQHYIGRASAEGKHMPKLNDILPFRWIDLLFLVPLLGGLVALLEIWGEIGQSFDNMQSRVIAHVVYGLALIGLYGALVFPFRYYLRRRSVGDALRSYVISSVILFAALMGTFIGAKYGFNLFPEDTAQEVGLLFGAIWLVFALIAFLIYGILAGQRALRSFRHNLKRLAEADDMHAAKSAEAAPPKSAS